MKCKHCGADNSNESKFCFQCGQELSSDDVQHSEDPPVDPTHPICKNCGASNTADAKFCHQCGQELSSEAEDPEQKSDDSWMNLPRRLVTIRFAPFAGNLIATLCKRTKLPLRTKAMVGEAVAAVCSCLGRLDCCADCAAKALKWNQKVNCGGCAKNAEKLISPLPMR